MANVLYIGNTDPSSTAAHRAYALQRLGHQVQMHNPYGIIGHERGKIRNHFHFRTGYAFLQAEVAAWMEKVVSIRSGFDAVWVDSGELIGPQSIRLLRKLNCPIILYNIDDPTGKRDKGRFLSLRKALPQYDLVAVVREETELECWKLGAKEVIRVLRSYDELAHQPFADAEQISSDFRSEVAFIGSWIRYEKRDRFLVELKEQGIPLSIWGGRWKKSPLWNELKESYRGGALGGRDYVSAIQGAKVCLGLLSKGNRDLHTTRTFEIPYAGGLLCAERTAEHTAFYKEGMEAVFWENAKECAQVCTTLLKEETLREQIRNGGMQKVRRLLSGNEDVCMRILQKIGL